MSVGESNKITSLAKWIAGGMSIFMCGYGLFVVFTQHYFGSTSRHGYVEINTNGIDAVLIGIAIIFLGLTPMSLWAKSGKSAGIWAGSCMISGILLFLIPFYMR